MESRICSRVNCSAVAACTLSHNYRDRMAVLGPLSPVIDPHNHDLCADCADFLTVPRGWTILRPVGLDHVH